MTYIDTGSYVFLSLTIVDHDVWSSHTGIVTECNSRFETGRTISYTVFEINTRNDILKIAVRNFTSLCSGSGEGKRKVPWMNFTSCSPIVFRIITQWFVTDSFLSETTSSFQLNFGYKSKGFSVCNHTVSNRLHRITSNSLHTFNFQLMAKSVEVAPEGQWCFKHVESEEAIFVKMKDMRFKTRNEYLTQNVEDVKPYSMKSYQGCVLVSNVLYNI